jgi:Domain of unknown function (DUF6457)
MTFDERSTPTLGQWWDQVTQALEIRSLAPPELMPQVLDLTRDVAHGVSRPAAPLAAFLLGVAVGSGADPEVAQGRIAGLLP